MKHTDPLFRTYAQHVDDGCNVCGLDKTIMCPKNRSFIGRHLSDPEKFYINENKRCHRFILSQREREKRDKEMLHKLSENIQIDIEI